MNDNKSTGNQEVIQRLKSAEARYVLISGCTKDHILSAIRNRLMMRPICFFTPEDAQAKAGELAGGNIDVKVAKLEDRQMLMFTPAFIPWE